jgi:hypothetical protein
MQVLLYSTASSPRLQYICRFIFEELLKAELSFTCDVENFESHSGIKIKYTNEVNFNGGFTIGDCGLLFKSELKEQDTACFEVNNYKAFFKTANADFPFDIFAASFYLLTRYEEYLPHQKDIYGRYAHENSLAFKQKFLQLPLINIWVKDLAIQLQTAFPSIRLQPLAFSFLPTYDIDMAFSYRHKGFLRNAGSFIKSPTMERLKVLAGLKQDPFDCYEWLNKLHEEYYLQPVYFFLMAEKNGVYDKNILPFKRSMWRLIRGLAKKYTTGIHPSWQSGDNSELIQQEKKLLETICQKPIIHSRQHYIRFTLPTGYRLLIENGITNDYSMGYGSINGFRASVATSFYWYDLQKNEATQLRVHPFCFMEANSFYEQKNTSSEASEELMHYFSVCKNVGGQLITIWHNNFLGTTPEIQDWKNMYQHFISKLKKASKS